MKHVRVLRLIEGERGSDRTSTARPQMVVLTVTDDVFTA